MTEKAKADIVEDAIENLTLWRETAFSADQSDAVGVVLTEIERLRLALDKIANWKPSFPGDDIEVWEIQAKARQALSPQEKP